ncbi:hypothetical protein OS493_003872 [Desmophyllum pertusum]|uniref:Transmembrane protein n=1 Tax=Desmophyllum pertusum TaxID=174260 RepID=A0A9X0A672_9CNID|nr:hypothetical protein OS493_003872 [Desmophyllum pertusum]
MPVQKLEVNTESGELDMSSILVAGVLGITGGFTGKFIVTGLFLAASVISCMLGGVVAACVGIALTARRSMGECEYVHCPYDTESILMIALVSILILEAAISLSGIIESSQLLCCAISGDDHISIVSLGNSHAGKTPMLRSERISRKLQSKNNGLCSADYDTPYEFRNGKQSHKISEMGDDSVTYISTLLSRKIRYTAFEC